MKVSLYSMLFTPAELQARAHRLPAHWSPAESARYAYAHAAPHRNVGHRKLGRYAHAIQRQSALLSRILQRVMRGTSEQMQLAMALVCLLALGLLVIAPLTTLGQAVFGLGIVLAASLINPLTAALTRCQRLLSMVIMLVVSTATLRYAWWRITETVVLDPWPSAIASVLMLLAEAYFWTMLLLGNFLAHWRLPRRAQAMPAEWTEWPHVDVFIPTYNESLAVVEPTVLAALDMDWPADKLHVWLLDDGKRDAFEKFAQESGCGYIRRTQNQHAKAGNINHALQKTEGKYVAIFDCDHIPASNFLKRALGVLEADPQCALVQTPHHFYSADPMERNLGLPVSVPNEGRLFYGQLQPGNDLWNATMFCGSCAVLRRSALEAVGGIAVETVTEDAHTSLRFSQRGYTTAYLNEPLAAGLATETLQGHVGQRVRWGRGMVQIFRSSCPLTVKGLRWHQRLTYLNACMYFLHGVPRLLVLIAPMLCFLLGSLVHASIAEWLVYLLPQLAVSRISEYKIQGKERGLFWGDVYETLLCWQLLRPTLTALFNPKVGKFNVTDKGQTLDEEFFDWHNGRVYLALALVNLLPLLYTLSLLGEPLSNEVIAALINGVWAIYNLLLCGVALHIACERRQVRDTVRVSVLGGASAMILAGRQRLQADLLDFSIKGLGLKLHASSSNLRKADFVKVALQEGSRLRVFRARIERRQGDTVGLELILPSMAQKVRLLRCTFTRPGFWGEQLRLASRHERKNLSLLIRTSLYGYVKPLALAWRKLLRQWASAPQALVNA